MCIEIWWGPSLANARMLLLRLNDKIEMVAIRTICGVLDVDLFQMVFQLKKNLIQ
jgi:hypothetical protein